MASIYDVGIQGGRGITEKQTSREGCMNFVVKITSLCGQGMEGVKRYELLLEVIFGSPLELVARHQSTFSKGAQAP